MITHHPIPQGPPPILSIFHYGWDIIVNGYPWPNNQTCKRPLDVFSRC